MTHLLAILALTTTGIKLITPESSSHLQCSFSMLNLSFVTPNSLSSLTLPAYILWLQQTQTADSEGLHPILPNQPLTMLQNPKATDYHENRVSFRLVYRIQRFIFIHNQQQTQFEPMELQVLPLNKVPALSSVQVLHNSSTHEEFCATPSPLVCLN